jgi:hypothetical protein
MVRARDTLASMASEFFREASVLVLVFGWLDKVVRNEAFAGAWRTEVLAVTGGLFAIGALLELGRAES